MAKHKIAVVSMLGCLVLTSAAFADSKEDKGKALFAKHCATCHGVDGAGTGVAGQEMVPPPANLKDAMQQKIISDEYLLWTIKEGGRNVHTEMPSFENQGELDETDAKAIVRYMWKAFK